MATADAPGRVASAWRWLQRPDGQRWLLRGVGLLLAVGVGAGLVVGADRPPDPHVVPAAASAGFDAHSSPVSRVPGFGQIGFRVVTGTARVEPLRCSLLADTPTSRGQGMMGRRDLAGYDAMIFRWVGTSTEGFYNKNVPIPLSIAWFDDAGVFVGATDLAVCDLNCPTVSPSVPYHLGLEVPKGGLGHLGIGQGSVLLIGGHC